MTCDYKIPPKEFNKDQAEQCRQCKYVSGKKVWCCKFGLWVDGRSSDGVQRIVKPRKKKIRKPPTLTELAGNFTKAMAKWAGSGFKLIDKAAYIERRLACESCDNKWRCPICGCVKWAKSALATEVCPEGKWKR